MNRLEMDAKALMAIDPILVLRGWELLNGLGCSKLLQKGASSNEISSSLNIKNKKMLICLLNFLVGKGILSKSSEKFKLKRKPTIPTQELYLFLYQNYYRSMIWLDIMSSLAPGVLVTGKAADEMGFGKESDLDLWEGIMSESPYSFRQAMIDLVLQNVPAGSEILDFGCGGGMGIEQTLKSSKKNISILGVDPSQYYLARAKKRLTKLKKEKIDTKKVKLRVYNFLNDESLQGKFDGIMMSLVLNHLTESEISKLFSMIKDNVADGGVIGIFQILNSDNFNRSPLCWIMHVIPSHKCYPDKSFYIAELRKNFKNVEEHFNSTVICAANPIR